MGLGVSDRDNETPIMKEETLVPKLADKPVNIFQKKNNEGMIGRASMKGFMKEELAELNQQAMKVQPTKAEETKGPEVKKKEDDKNAQEPVMGLEGGQQQTKVPLKTIDQLLIHNSDTAVKPIIGNKDIEKHGELVFNAQ